MLVYPGLKLLKMPSKCFIFNYRLHRLDATVLINLSTKRQLCQPPLPGQRLWPATRISGHSTTLPRSRPRYHLIHLFRLCLGGPPFLGSLLYDESCSKLIRRELAQRSLSFGHQLRCFRHWRLSNSTSSAPRAR